MAGSELPRSLGDSLKRNERRVEEAADQASWKRLLDDASHVDLWDGVRRHERSGWKDWLDTADKLTAQPRTALSPVSSNTTIMLSAHVEQKQNKESLKCFRNVLASFPLCK